MRKFQPLDLSFIAAAGSPERESFRNVAAMINANAGWSQPSQAMLKEYKELQEKAAKEAASKHKPTFISGLFDLLSVPLYAVGNALDESIAGHQKDNNDNILQDALQMAGGAFTGNWKGIGAGLRGATSMLDSLPGVDISDEWQSDPTDKTRFGDVNVRVTSKMSTKDAMKPENWDKAQANIEKEKAELDSVPWLRDFFYPEMGKENSREEYFKRMKLLGIGEDVLGDPLNFLTLGGKSAVSATKGITEGLDAARSGINVAPQIVSGLKAGKGGGKKSAPKFGSLPIPSGAPTLSQIAPSGGVNVPLPGVPIAAQKGSIKTLGQIGGREKVAKQGVEISGRDQKHMVQNIAKLAEVGKPDWIYRAADVLRRHPNVEFPATTRFLDLANKMAKAKGIRHNAAQMGTTLAARIAEDVAAARKVTPAERILNTANPTDIVMHSTKAKLRPQNAKIANETIARFRNQVLGTERAAATGEGLVRAIAAGENARWSGPQQAQMWNHITRSIKFTGPKKYEVAAKIAQHVEDFFISKGAIPYSSFKIADSVEGLRISQVAFAIGPKAMAENPNLVTKILRGDEAAMRSLTAEQAQAIENLKASEAMASAPAAAKGIGAGKNAAAEILSKVQSAGRAKEELRNVPRIGSRATANLGGGPVASKVAAGYLNKLVNQPGGIDRVFKSNWLTTQSFLANSARHGRNFNPVGKAFNKSVTNAVYKAAQLPPAAQLGKTAGAAARVKEAFGARFNAAYGVKDMRHIFLRNQASALSTSARRAQFINQLARNFDPKDVDLWHEAFRAAQADSITAGRVSDLQKEVSKIMENLFGGTGLKAGAIADSTVAGRSRLYLDELNTSLRRFGLGQYQFSNGKKVKDAAGTTHDFSKGVDWLKSWEAWDVKKPYEFLHRIQQAIEHTVREKNMFDEIAGRFGSPNKHKGVSYAIDHPRLKGYYFTEVAARQGEKFVKILNEVNTPAPKSLQYLDHVISKIKASLTIYIPSHHWTNIIGDTMFNWYAGVNNPHRYTQAIKVMTAQKGRYGDIASFHTGLAGHQALSKAIIRGRLGTDALMQAGLKVHAAGNAPVITMRNGQKITADMIYTAAMHEGIMPSARVLEEITSDVSSILDKFRPLGGKGQRAVHQVSEIRDHIPRLAQFIDGIAKHGGSFGRAAEESAANVRKWHPDGLDITKFERNVMKRVFPFYSWTRKAIPLAIESVIVNGNKVMAYPRLMEAIATANGVEGENETTGGMFPGDQMFPDWIRERGIGPVAGGPGSYLVVNPSTPTLDIFTMMGHPGQTGLDMMNPLAKIPLELSQGSTLGKTVPIENEADYLARQIPGVSHAGRVSGYYGTSDSVAGSDEQKMLNLMNMIFGTKATQTGIYQKSAQFDLMEYFRDKAKGNG